MPSKPYRPRKANKRFRPFLEALEGRLPPATDIFTVPGNPGDQTPVNFTFLQKQGVFQNEIGVYAVDDAAGTVNGVQPGNANYAQQALNRAQAVVSSGSRIGTNTQLTFAAGTRLAFYLVQNNSRAAVLNANPQNIVGRGAIAFFSIDGAGADNFDHVLATAQGDGGMRVQFEDLTGGGDQDFNDAIISVGGNGLFRTPGQVGQTVATTFNWTGRDAGFSNELGLFQVSDTQGRVNGLLPGVPGYAQAALQNAQIIFPQGSDAGATRTLNLPGGRLFALYLVQNTTTSFILQNNPNNVAGGGRVAFFSVVGANPDGVAHFDFLSATSFGFEDLFGGGDFDFNDLNAAFSFGAITGTPLNDGLAPSITARLQNDTFDPTRLLPPDNAASDLRSSDYSITGTVTDISQVTTFRASIDNTNVTVDVLNTLQPNGTFVFDQGRMEAIFDPTNNPNVQLSDGVHTLRLQAADEFGNTSQVFTFVFTLDRIGPATTMLLAQASDTGVVGEFRTDSATVTLSGTTEANSPVRLVRSTTGATIATTTASANGNYSFTGVALDPGPNGLKVFTVDVANNQGESGATITRNRAPVTDAVPGLATIPQGGSTQIDLTPHFPDPDSNLPVVRVQTVLGDFLLQLFTNNTPQHVQNFLNYVAGNDFDNTIFHRSVPGFVIQGGGFRFTGGNPNLADVPTDPPVTNEPGLPNSRGTISLAKQDNQPNSGTNEWFVNLADNTANLDNQNGGFTVFAQVLGNGQTVYDAIAAVQRFNLGGFNGIPLRNFNGTTLQDANANNFVIINDVSVIADPLTYSIISNSNPALVNASITNNTLTVTSTGAGLGQATIVIRATDPDGTNSTTDYSILVTVT